MDGDEEEVEEDEEDEPESGDSPPSSYDPNLDLLSNLQIMRCVGEEQREEMRRYIRFLIRTNAVRRHEAQNMQQQQPQPQVQQAGQAVEPDENNNAGDLNNNIPQEQEADEQMEVGEDLEGGSPLMAFCAFGTCGILLEYESLCGNEAQLNVKISWCKCHKHVFAHPYAFLNMSSS